MRTLTEDAILLCDHGGQVHQATRQSWVTINKRKVLVRPDPEQRSISGCPNTNPLLGIKPCTNSLAVTVGYSTFIKIDGAPVCLDTVTGLTDGTPPGLVKYTVKNPGQTLVGMNS